MTVQSSGSNGAKPPDTLFIFGVARSGTSFMQELLNSHPGIRMSYEGRIVREGGYLYNQHGNLKERPQFDRLLEELCHAKMEEKLNRWMIESMRDHADELFRRHNQEPSFAKLIENIYMLPGAVPCWGNKILRVEECLSLFGLWPHAKAAILIRDPRAVYASQARFLQTRIKYSTMYWNLHSRWTRDHATDPQRFLVIRYEDFVEDAPAVLEKILRLAGVWDARVAGMMLAEHPPSKSSVNVWRERLTPDEIRTVESLCYDQMQHWGYSPEIAPGPGRMGTAARSWEIVRENLRYVPLDPRWWMRKHVIRRFFRMLRG